MTARVLDSESSESKAKSFFFSSSLFLRCSPIPMPGTVASVFVVSCRRRHFSCFSFEFFFFFSSFLFLFFVLFSDVLCLFACCSFLAKDPRRLMQLLLEGEFVVLMALVESLSLEGEGKALDEVADVLLAFMTEQNKIVPFLKLLISREVPKKRKDKRGKKSCSFFKLFSFSLLCVQAANTENPSTLFRGNSVASKILSRYTLIQGEVYLKNVLLPLFKKANAIPASEVELNPEKVTLKLRKGVV